MSKSSINFQTAKFNSSEHMSRHNYVSYLIEHDASHYTFKHYKDANKALNEAQNLTKKLTNRKMQKLAVDNFIQEAVLNIKSDTELKDVQNLFKKFNEKFGGGFDVFEIALHKDEGVFIKSKYDIKDLTFDSKNLKVYRGAKDVTNEVISFAPNRDIFYNKKDKNWYKDKHFIHQIDTTKLQKKMNYHAHISFTKFDKNKGKNIRLKKKDLQDIQTITANEMKMTRGEINSKTKRLNHYQIKKLQAKLNDTKLSNLATKRDLDLINNNLRTELRKNKAKRAEYAQLEKEVKELRIKIKNKDLTIEELNKKLNKEEICNFTIDFDKDILVNKLKKDNTELKENNLKLENKNKENIKVFDILKTKYEHQNSKVRTLESEVNNLKFKNTELKKDNTELENKISELEIEVEKSNKKEFKILTKDEIVNSLLQQEPEQPKPKPKLNNFDFGMRM